MKRIIFIAAGILVLLSLGTYFTFSRSKSETQNEQSINNKQEPSCCVHKMASGEISDNSIYQLEAVWKNEMNRNVNLSDFKGKHVVLSMIFANCTYACPVIINDMKRIESKMNSNELNDTRFVLVSIDPDRDTPKALYELSKRQNLDLNRWTLLTGTKNEVRELAALFGFQYQKNENGDYLHSNLINILNENGEIIYQYKGLNQDVSMAVDKLSMLN